MPLDTRSVCLLRQLSAAGAGDQLLANTTPWFLKTSA